MKNAEILKTSLGLGLGAAALVFSGAEITHHFDPADMRQEQVDTCAPHMPLAGNNKSLTIPHQCLPFADDLANNYGIVRTYNLPTQGDFIDRFTPGPNYNTVQMWKYGDFSIAVGTVITALSAVTLWAESNPYDPTPERPAPNAPLTYAAREHTRRDSSED